MAIAPDGDLIVADSHNDRIRRVDKQTTTIVTIAGSAESGYDGDDKPATEARLNTPGVARGNWSWRLRGGQLTPALASWLADETRAAGRAP